MKRVLVLFALLLSGSIALAQPGGAPPPPPPPPPGGYAPAPTYYGPAPAYAYAPNPAAHRHDDFYLRMLFGIGYTQMKVEDQDAEIIGAGGMFSIALGANVSPNLIIFGELLANVASNPTFKMGGTEIDTEDVSAGSVGVGGGLAYYFMPSNLYISGSITASQLSIQENNREIGETEFGPGVSLVLGKEWWVSDNWGLGIAAQFFAARMKDKGADDVTWTTSSFAIAFSATYD